MAQLAGGLLALGVGPGDRVALVAENRPEWIVADYAIMAVGAITVPAYTTNTVADNRHIFGNAGVKGVIASTRALAERAFAAALETPGCAFLIAIEPRTCAQNAGMRLLSLGGRAVPAHGAGRGAWRSGLKRTDLACIIHTSGTGGLPKGVALSHGAILANCLGAYDLLVELGLERRGVPVLPAAVAFLRAHLRRRVRRSRSARRSISRRASRRCRATWPKRSRRS